jgi:hypothetical protein
VNSHFFNTIHNMEPINYFYGILIMKYYFWIGWKVNLQYFIATEANAIQVSAKAFGFPFIMSIFKLVFADRFDNYNWFTIVENNFKKVDYFRWGLKSLNQRIHLASFWLQMRQQSLIVHSGFRTQTKTLFHVNISYTYLKIRFYIFN